MTQPQVALVCSGPVSRTSLSRLPGLATNLGLVKGINFRLASRTANALKAGRPVREYSELRDSRVVLLYLAEGDLDMVLGELTRAFPWRDKTAVLYETAGGCEVIQQLRSKGAQVASLNNLGGLGREHFIVEADPPVAREVRALLLNRQSKVVEIPRGKKRAYLRAVHLATQVFPSLVAEMSETLRGLRLPKTESDRLTALMLTEAMAAYFRGGRRSVPLDINWQTLLGR